MKIFSVKVLLQLTAISCILAACTTPPPLPPQLELPTPSAQNGPPIPFTDPNMRGIDQIVLAPFDNQEQLQACLALGQTVYGVALQNSNVRAAPDLNACRVGRIPRGSLVEVTGIITVSNGIVQIATPPPSPLTLVATPVASPPVTTTVRTLAPTAVATTVTPTLRSNLTSSAPPLPRNGAGNETAAADTLGYVEDIQPIFQRACIACHSGVVQQLGLQVTAYGPLMQGSSRGAVVIPGDPEASVLWQMVGSGKMPLIGELSPEDKALIRRWIALGAPEQRTGGAQVATAPVDTEVNTEAAPPQAAELWLEVTDTNVGPVPDLCPAPAAAPQQVVSSNLILPISCGVEPGTAQFQNILRSLAISPATAADLAQPAIPSGSPPAASASASDNAPPVVAAASGLQAAALGLPTPSDGDGWMQARGGFCVEQHLPKNERGITALAFAPDGRLFMALDTNLDGQPDPNILYDAYHPSRSIAVYDPVNRYAPEEILVESSRITGMAYANGALFLNRAGEAGWIPDGGSYRPLAGGFAVNSQLFHANDGIVITNGYVYISAGGVRDGYSDGPIQGIAEAGALDVVTGGNHFAARLLRAPLDRLINEHSINVFETAARGLRNPYGLTVDPSGRLWFTDNGATNVPEHVSAGDEVDVFDPRTTPPGTSEDSTPYYGFPLAITSPQPWYTLPVVDLPNTSAPTGITWAYGTIFYGQYGRDPGLYRLGRAADGRTISERIMLVWPLLAVTTAPDGALWIGTGTGGLYRMTPGCGS
ncbi:MAG: c-type cytochrome domain-containing protein [Caldilineaceae bacterium]